MVDSSFPGCYINAKISGCFPNRDLLEIMQKVSFSAQLFSISLRKMWDRFAKTKLRIRMKYLIYQKLWCFHPWSRAKFDSQQNGKESNLSEILSWIVFEKVKVDSCTSWRLNQCQLVADHQGRSSDSVFLIRNSPWKKCTVFEDGRGGEASESHISYLDQHLMIGNVKIETWNQNKVSKLHGRGSVQYLGKVRICHCLFKRRGLQH